MNSSPRPLAPLADRDSSPWWEALARHQLVLQRCASCQRWRWPPRALCNRCASFEWRWERSGGRGRVASWIVNHHRFFATPEPPYAVVTVRLVEQSDLLMPGSFTGDIGELSMGLGVVAAYDDVVGEDGQAFTLLSWRRASDEGGEP